MLNVVSFIKNHSDWKELLTTEPYYIQIKRKDSLVMFNYTQGASQPCEIVNECRGLILDESDDFKVIRYGFYRFYNFCEPGAAKVDIDSLQVLEKIDGSLIMIYWYENRWHISTRATFDCDNTPTPCDENDTFGRLVRLALFKQNVELYSLDKDYTHCFELVSPKTRVIINYPETKLYYLMSRNNNTYEEAMLDIGVEKPRTYDFFIYPARHSKLTIDRVLEMMHQQASEQNGAKFEGFVCVDKYGNRVKVKNDDWVRIHILHANGKITEQSSLELIFYGEYDEFVSYFPEFNDRIMSYSDKYEQLMIRAFKLDKCRIDRWYSRKELAQIVNQMGIADNNAWMIYNAYKHKAFEYFMSLDMGKYLLTFGEKKNG